MNFGSKFNRVKQQADRLFLRGDRTDVVGELRYAEEQAEELRVLCEAFSRSLEKRLNTHMVTEEKKPKKVPENQVAEILKEALKEASQNQTEEFNEKPLFKTTVEEIVAVEQLLGKEVLDHEEQVEAEVLTPLYKLLKEDFPLVAKQKKALKQAGQDVDAAKAKVRSSHASVSQPNKLENYREELEEVENKLEQIKDSYACDLFGVLGKQREVVRLSNLYLEMKVDHLQKSLQGLNIVLPPIRKILEDSSCSPVYGVPLYEHLRITQQEIAVPIQICVKRMIEFGMYEEGLLRVAGSSTKIKRLKGLFDAGLITVETTLADYNRDYDVHVIAGAFKGYLRELPEPLLTHTKHDELVEAVRKQDHKEKLRHMWQVINALPMQNYNNLRYVIKFLANLASYSSENKMTPNNIAIVMAPNLIGSQRENDNEIMLLGRNMSLGNDYRVAVEQLIEYCVYFFKEEVDFGVQPRHPEPPPSPKTTVTTSANGTYFTRIGSHRRTGSTDFNIMTGSQQQQQSVHPESESPKQPHRIKKKPAPLPPQGKAGWFDETGQVYPSNSSPEPTRSKTPPSSAIFSNSALPLSNPTPSPAPRLHHTNSIKRPTAEPPKPPGVAVPPVKPPRPSPPSQLADNQNETKEIKPPRPCPPQTREVKGITGGDPPTPAAAAPPTPAAAAAPPTPAAAAAPPTPAAAAAPPTPAAAAAPTPAAAAPPTLAAAPIGFENIEVNNPVDDDCNSSVVRQSASNESSKEEGTVKQGPVIGFHIEGLNVKEKVREKELIREQSSNEGPIKTCNDIELRKGNGGVTDPEFRKSLEGVLKHQPQTHSRHLVRQCFGNESSSGECQQENKAPVQLPAFPVPAHRSSKDTSSNEKPEPAPRSDKPAIPEKPTAINRSAIAGDHSRLIIHDRPVVLGSKASALSNCFTKGMSRSSEKIVEMGHSGSEHGCGADKSETVSDHDTSSMERPSKPPKPSNVRVSQENETTTTTTTTAIPAISLIRDEQKESGSDPETKSASSGSDFKPDSTHL